MSQIYKNSSGSGPGTGIQTLSAEGGTHTAPDGSNNFDFMGGGPDAGSSPFLVTDTVSFGITSAGHMKANAVFPHWQVIAASQSAAKSQGYILNSVSSQLTITLPTMPTVGDSFVVFDMAGGGFLLEQNNGDSIQLGSDLTTTGVSGNLESTEQGNSITLVCWASGPGASWIALPPTGSFEVN